MSAVNFPPRAASESATASRGVIVNFESVEFIEMVSLAGFDFVMLDAEHGPLTPSSSAGMIRAANSAGLRMMVRTPGLNAFEVQRYLDLGAHAVQAQADNAADVEHLVDSVFYAPKGRRGLSVSTPAAAYGERESVVDYIQRVNNQASVFVTVETLEAVMGIDAITACKHLSGVSIGTGDLSHAMGFSGNRRAPPVVAAVARIVAACRHAGIQVMMPAGDMAAALEAVELGATGIQFPASALVVGSGRKLLKDLSEAVR